MVRPTHQADEHREYISKLYNQGVSRSQIRDRLKEKFNLSVSLTTLSRRIGQWGLENQQQRTAETPELVAKIDDYMFRIGLTEKQTFYVLRRQGFSISRYGLARIRLERGWKRRIDDPEERLALLEKTYRTFLSMTEQSNALMGYGRRVLPAFIRQQAGLRVPRDSLFEVYRVMFPDAIEIRKRAMRRHKGQFLVPGPNYQWCIDGHDKLKEYGFEIYAAIDAYSRCIIWLYIGHSASTSLSVLKQYIEAVREYKVRPWFIQADLGSETPLVAAAHWNFAICAGGKVEWNGKIFEQGVRMKDSYKTATSTKNVKIEKMWESMLHCCSREWVDYFGELKRDGDFDKDMIEDQIAMYAVFEDRLRAELFDFVQTWNCHNIRLQRNRPHVVHGMPWMNYHFSDPAKACNWGIPIDLLTVEEVARPLIDIDLGTCLEPETKMWCNRILTEMGIDEVKIGSHRDPDKLRPFKRFYINLRDKIILHLESGEEPELRYRTKPRGGSRNT